MLSQPSVRIHDLFAETSVDGGYGYVALDIVMQSILLNPKEYTVCYELLDPKGEVVAMSQKDIVTGMLSRDTVRFTVRIPDPLVWNHETPTKGPRQPSLHASRRRGITASLQTELPSRTVSMRFATVWGCTCAMRRISIRVGNRPVSPWAAIRATLPNGKMPTSTGYTACITLRTFIRRW